MSIDVWHSIDACVNVLKVKAKLILLVLVLVYQKWNPLLKVVLVLVLIYQNNTIGFNMIYSYYFVSDVWTRNIIVEQSIWYNDGSSVCLTKYKSCNI